MTQREKRNVGIEKEEIYDRMLAGGGRSNRKREANVEIDLYAVGK